MKVLMVGATGKFARSVVPELTKRGVTVRALLRDETKIDAAKKAGAQETAIGDLSNEAAGIPDGHLKDGLKAMYAHYDKCGFPGGNSLVLAAILKREPRTLSQFIYELAELRARS